MQGRKQTARTTRWDPDAAPSYWINQASRLLLRIFDARLKPHGFSMGQLPVLLQLGGGEVLSQREIAERSGLAQPTIAEMLARMARDGLLRREADPSDGRATRLSLERGARARVPAALAELVRGNEQAIAGLTDDEAATLVRLLQKVTANLREVAAKELG